MLLRITIALRENCESDWKINIFHVVYTLNFFQVGTKTCETLHNDSELNGQTEIPDALLQQLDNARRDKRNSVDTIMSFMHCRRRA